MSTHTPDFRAEWHTCVQTLLESVFDLQTFISASFSFKAPLDELGTRALRIRSVEIKDTLCWQFIRGSNATNLDRRAGLRMLTTLLNDHPVDTFHVQTAEQDLHGRISKKGRILTSRSRKKLDRDPARARAHDREKDYPLTRFDSSRLLRVLGIADTDGSCKPSMHAKYRQVNEFLRILDATVNEIRPPEGRPLRLLDAGCGKAYLAFSAKAYLESTRDLSIALSGIDWNARIISGCERMAEAMEWMERATFHAGDIATYAPETNPDIILSLHACDTATDNAIAFGVEHDAAAILCAPCCQHELQTQLGSTGPHRALLRNGILKERFADVLTDAFRAQILRVMGYRTTVIEFIDSEATGRNILIKGIRARRIGTESALADYRDLHDAWSCTPFLAKRLAARCPDLCPETVTNSLQP